MPIQSRELLKNELTRTSLYHPCARDISRFLCPPRDKFPMLPKTLRFRRTFFRAGSARKSLYSHNTNLPIHALDLLERYLLPATARLPRQSLLERAVRKWSQEVGISSQFSKPRHPLSLPRAHADPFPHRYQSQTVLENRLIAHRPGHSSLPCGLTRPSQLPGPIK